MPNEVRHSLRPVIWYLNPLYNRKVGHVAAVFDGNRGKDLWNRWV